MANIDSVAVAVTSMTEAVVSAMESVGDAFKEAADAISDRLVPAVNEATEAFKDMAEAARAAADAASDAGKSSYDRTGVGFQHGTGGIRMVPPGFPNDSYRIGLTSGEQFWVGRRGEDLPSGRTTINHNNFSLTIQSRDCDNVIQNYRLMQAMIGD